MSSFNQSDDAGVVEIVDAIKSYAAAYSRLEKLQQESPLLTAGDQKTGVIGEFYALLYLKDKNKGDQVEYAPPNTKGYDIVVGRADAKRFVQVKTVSSYSKDGRMSPIHGGWDELFLTRVDDEFRPIGFWITDDTSIAPKGTVLENRAMPDPGRNRPGSKEFKDLENQIEKLRLAIHRAPQ